MKEYTQPENTRQVYRVTVLREDPKDSTRMLRLPLLVRLLRHETKTRNRN